MSKILNIFNFKRWFIVFQNKALVYSPIFLTMWKDIAYKLLFSMTENKYIEHSSQL